jgi:hypothetical protein
LLLGAFRGGNFDDVG